MSYTPRDQKIGISTAPKPRGSTIAKRFVLHYTNLFAIDRTAGAFARFKFQFSDRAGY